MNFLVRDRNLSVSTEVRDGKAVNSYIFCSSRSYLNSVYPLTRRDHWFAFEGGSMKTNSRRFDLRGNSTNSDEISLHGIQDIVPLSGNCGSKYLNLKAAKKKKNRGFFRGLGPSFWTAVASGISSKKGVELCDEDINLLISGKTPKVPQEHADVNGLHFQIETDSPSDAGTTQENNSASSQTISDTGKPAVQVSKSQTGSNNSSHSSSGGDDGDDGRRQDVPVGSCQHDSQYSVDNSEEDKQQLEEHSNHGGDTLHNQDSMSIPASVPSDTGNSQDKTGASNQKVGQTPTDEGKSAGQVSKSPTGSNSYCCSSSGDGGDDGDDRPRQNVPPGGCQGDKQCSVDDNEEHEQQAEEQSHQSRDCPDNQDSMSTATKVPSDTGNGKEKSTSNQKVGQTPTDEGKPAGQVANSPTGSNSYCCSSSGNGGDDGDDRPRQNVPPGGCQGDNQCSVDDNEEHEQQPEKQSHQSSDCPDNQDSMSTATKVPSDTGNGKEKSTSNQKVGQTPTDKGKPAGQVAKIQHGNTSYRRSSSGSGGDDGGEDGKCNLFTGGCQVSAPSCDGAKKSAAQGLRIKVTGARMIAEASFESQGKSIDLQSEAAGGLFLSDQLNCHHPEADLHEAGQRLQQAFTCRRHLDSENEWKQCAEASCREIQEYVSHSQNCLKRVLGGCIKCIRYKEVLFYHVSRCHLPMEACVVEKCDIIRQYMKENRLPDNRKWPYQLDNIFFSPTPPAWMPYIRQGITWEERGEVIWPLDQQVLSVGEDGSYVEGVHWRQVEYIGGGSCGRCYFCEDSKTGYLFAIKKIPVRKFQQMELDTWGSISGQHPNILKLYGAVKHKETVVIFMEYMEGGSVKEYGKLDEGRAVLIIHEVISAVEFMHSQRLLHRDISDGNVLLDASGQKVKLADFGTTIRCDGYLQDNIPRGTQAFMAPEVCRSKQYSSSIDIWELMCVFYRMLAGKRPWMEFSHDSLLLEIGKASQPPQCPPCSPEVEEFFSRGFVLDPSKRATAAELLQHPVFGTGPSVSNIPLPSREKILLGKDALRSEEEQLQSLQSDLLLSLEGQDLERALNEIEENADVNDNDINRLKGEDFDVGQIIGSLLGDANLSSLQPPLGAFATPEGSYSITDLTRLHLKDSEGNLLFTIRERPSTSYGHLGEEEHGNIASVLQLDAFTLTREDGTALNVRAEIGFEEQAVRVVRAHDTDNWQPYRWRVDGYGRVEQFFEI